MGFVLLTGVFDGQLHGLIGVQLFCLDLEQAAHSALIFYCLVFVLEYRHAKST
jgi:hypothetical protein